MKYEPKIDFIAPPFSGHLFPLISLAVFLQDQNYGQIRIFSTTTAKNAIEISGLQGVYLLDGKAAQVDVIANPPRHVKSNPLLLAKQFSENLALMGAFKAQLRDVWEKDKPDLVIADFTLPIAGVLAQEMDIPWWTSLPSPCVLETKTGTPAYLGGWMPGDSRVKKFRDACGRFLIRRFKKTIGWWFHKELEALGINGVYRSNGHEAAYSPEKILALGMKEFEFERDWPDPVDFFGPVTNSPAFPHTPPVFDAGKKHVLVSLGTHLAFVKEKAALFVENLAKEMHDVVFHFSYGNAAYLPKQSTSPNVCYYNYIPYDLYIHHYDAAIIHGGTGVTYSCINAGVPILAWPQDYDQFDNSARIVANGLGRRLKPNILAAVADLNMLMMDENVRSQCSHFQQLTLAYHPHQKLLREIQMSFEISSVANQ